RLEAAAARGAARSVRQGRGDLDAIVLKALEKDRSRRHGSGEGPGAGPEGGAPREPGRAPRRGAGGRAGQGGRRRPAGGAPRAGSSAAALVLAALAWQLKRENEQKEQQRAEAVGQRERAEGNLRHALAAVNRFYTDLSQGRLLNEPRQEPVRRELLQAALD